MMLNPRKLTRGASLWFVLEKEPLGLLLYYSVVSYRFGEVIQFIYSEHVGLHFYCSVIRFHNEFGSNSHPLFR